LVFFHCGKTYGGQNIDIQIFIPMFILSDDFRKYILYLLGNKSQTFVFYKIIMTWSIFLEMGNI